MSKFTRVISVSLFNVALMSISYVLADVVGLAFTSVFSGFVLGIASSDILENIVGFITTFLLTSLAIIVYLIAIGESPSSLTQSVASTVLILLVLILISQTVLYILFRRIAYR